MRRFLASMFGFKSKAKSVRKSSSRRAQLGLEALEQREATTSLALSGSLLDYRLAGAEPNPFSSAPRFSVAIGNPDLSVIRLR